MSSTKRKSNTKYMTKYITEFDLQNYLNNNNDVNVLVSTSYCSQTMTGICRCLLLYKGAYKLLELHQENVQSPNHTMVLSLSDCMKQLSKSGFTICIISGIYVGFRKALSGKGVYADEVNDILYYAEKNGNEIKSIAIPDGMEEIKSIIARYERIIKHESIKK